MSHEANTTCPCRSREPGFAIGCETGAETPENRHQPGRSRAENRRKTDARSTLPADEWDVVVRAAERNDVTPGAFVRETATRSAAENLDLSDAQLTPELIELVKRTFRGVHLLAFLKREELAEPGKEDDIKRAAEAAKVAQSSTLGAEDSY